MTARAFATALVGVLGIWWIVRGVSGALAVVSLAFRRGGDLPWYEEWSGPLIASIGMLAIGIAACLRREAVARWLVRDEGDPPPRTASALDAGSFLAVAIFCTGLWLVASSLGGVIQSLFFLRADVPETWWTAFVTAVPLAVGAALVYWQRTMTQLIRGAGPPAG